MEAITRKYAEYRKRWMYERMFDRQEDSGNK